MTPDGRWVTYTSANLARTGLWKIIHDGSGDRGSLHGEISPDGAFVLYRRSPSWAPDRRLRFELPTESFGVSADGRRIVGSEADPSGAFRSSKG